MLVLIAIVVVIVPIIWEKYDRKYLYPKREQEMKEKEKEYGVKW